MNDIAKIEDDTGIVEIDTGDTPPATVPATTPENQMISMIERMVMNPEVDADKMQKIIDMKNSEEDREAEKAYTRAMVSTQQSLKAVTRDKTNNQTHSNYPSLEAMAKAIVPAYTANGLAISYGEGNCPHEGQIRVTCKVMHEAGHSENFFYDCPVDNKGIKGNVNKTETHGKASGVSYGQRYLLKLIFNVTIQDEDDDGNAAGNNIERISEDQALTIHSMLTDNDLDVAAFESWLSRDLKCHGINNVSVDSYEFVVNQIKAKINKNQKKKDNDNG